MAFKFQVVRKMRGTGVALLEVNDPGSDPGQTWLAGAGGIGT